VPLNKLCHHYAVGFVLCIEFSRGRPRGRAKLYSLPPKPLSSREFPLNEDCIILRPSAREATAGNAPVLEDRRRESDLASGRLPDEVAPASSLNPMLKMELQKLPLALPAETIHRDGQSAVVEHQDSSFGGRPSGAKNPSAAAIHEPPHHSWLVWSRLSLSPRSCEGSALPPRCGPGLACLALICKQLRPAVPKHSVDGGHLGWASAHTGACP